MHIKDLPFEPMGAQSVFEARALERFVAAPRIATLAYARRDGTPNQFPIWYAYEDGRFLMLTSSTSPKPGSRTEPASNKTSKLSLSFSIAVPFRSFRFG